MMSRLSIGVQLYTLRDLTPTDLPGVLRKMKQIGYAGVELAGYGNLKDAAEVRKAVDDAGLVVCGMHVGIEAMEADMAQVLDDAETLGCRLLVVPWMVPERRGSAMHWKQTAGELNLAGLLAHQRGIELAYHNHDFEFDRFDGQSAFDLIWSSTRPELVKSELDLFWVKAAGHDPIECMNRLGRRVVAVHLKDMAPGNEKKFASVGSGTLDFKAITTAASQLGVQWGIVEQDDCYGQDPVEAVTNSFNHLKEIGAA